MLRKKITKIIMMLLFSTTVISSFPQSVSAAWKEDNKGYWYTEGRSYAKGWRLINGKYYYFNPNNGYMLTSSVIDGYYVNKDGVWIDPAPYNFSNYSDVLYVKGTDDKKTKKIIKNIEGKNVKILGDSLTCGYGGSNYSNSGESICGLYNANETGNCWANELRDYLEKEYDCSVKNWGVSGWSSLDIVWNLDKVITDSDDVIICAIGANNCYIDDGLTKLKADIPTINNYCTQKGKDIIFVGTMPTLTGKNETLGIQMEDIDNALGDTASKLDIPFVPVYTLWAEYTAECNYDPGLLYHDEEHLNDKGYNLMYYLISSYLFNND